MRCVYKVIVVLSVAFASVAACAQNITVKAFSMLMEPMTVPMQRKDNNGNICALVKVVMPSAQAAFEGSLIGNCEYKTAEYWCYLTPGCKFLKVKYPGCEPLLVNFEDFIGSGVKSRMIYELHLSVPEVSRDAVTFPVKGKILIEGSVRQATDVRSGVKLYHNLSDGRYQSVVNAAEMAGSVLGGELEYELSGVRLGDSLTVVAQHADYVPSTIVVTPERMGRGDLDIRLSKKRETRKGCLVDRATKKPLAGVEIYDHFFNGALLAVTDSTGTFALQNCVVDNDYQLYFKNMPRVNYVNHNQILRSGVSPSSTQIFYVGHYYTTIYLKKGDVSAKDITAVCDDDGADAKVTLSADGKYIYVSYPDREDAISVTISCAGYKTLKVKGSGETLKLEKGNPRDVVELTYDAYGKLLSRKNSVL